MPPLDHVRTRHHTAHRGKNHINNSNLTFSPPPLWQPDWLHSTPCILWATRNSGPGSKQRNWSILREAVLEESLRACHPVLRAPSQPGRNCLQIDEWIDHGSKNTPLVYFARFYAQALLNGLPRGARRDDRRLSDLLRARHYYNVSYEVLFLAVPGCFIPCRIPVRDDNSDVDNWENVRHVALILNLDRSVIAL